MDKATLEYYLEIYPDIDNEISKLEAEISVLENSQHRYSNFDDEYSKSILESINIALESCKNDLREMYEAKAKIIKAFPKLNAKQKKIIKLRTEHQTWKEISSILKYHPNHIQRIYKNTLRNILLN
mgnify:CR=1 FL=1